MNVITTPASTVSNNGVQNGFELARAHNSLNAVFKAIHSLHIIMILSAESECLNKHNGDDRVCALRHLPTEILVLRGDE